MAKITYIEFDGTEHVLDVKPGLTVMEGAVKNNVPALLRHPLLKGGTSRSTRRLRTIFHTNLATAHAAGQWARIQQNKRALPYLKYIPSYANSPRDGHKRYYNLILPVEHELWAQIMPPNGYGCLCGVRQLTRRQALRERGEVGEAEEHDPVRVHGLDLVRGLGPLRVESGSRRRGRAPRPRSGLRRGRAPGRSSAPPGPLRSYG